MSRFLSISVFSLTLPKLIFGAFVNGANVREYSSSSSSGFFDLCFGLAGEIEKARP